MKNREEEIKRKAVGYSLTIRDHIIEKGTDRKTAEDISDIVGISFAEGMRFADKNPSDETIMSILNCIGYEEEGWIDFVRKELEKRKATVL